MGIINFLELWSAKCQHIEIIEIGKSDILFQEIMNCNTQHFGGLCKYQFLIKQTWKRKIMNEIFQGRKQDLARVGMLPAILRLQ